MENKKESSDGEDIPSDFFDDFNKEEFIEGLSVIDSWNDEDKQPVSARQRINAEALDSVRDLRELIAKESQDGKRDCDRYQKRMLYFSDQRRSIERKHEGSTSHLDDYIKPGSRRDRTKTNEAIKRDKEEKVKEYLAKHLESSDDICPPGTELDDFLEEKRTVEITKIKLVATISNNVSPPKKLEPSPLKRRRETSGKRRESTGTRRESPGKFHESPGRYRDLPGWRRFSPGRRHESPGRRHDSPGRRRESPGRRRDSPGRRRDSPGRRRDSPGRRRESPGIRRESPGRRRHSPGKRHDSPPRRREFSPRFRRVQWSPRRQYQSSRQNYGQFSPQRYTRHHQRNSPLRSPETHHNHHSRSPYKRPLRRSRSRSVHRSERRDHRRSLSRSPNHKTKKDDFLYPKEYFPPPTEFPVETEMPYPVAPAAAPPYTEPMPVEYVAPNYAYGPGVGPAYSGYGAPYDYGIQPASMPLPVPQPVPAPITTPDPSVPALGQPTIVPAPQHIVSSAPNLTTLLPQLSQNKPVDALAKLVADGKLSHEDYLKLAPNKGVNQSMDTQARVAVLNRCHNAMAKLGSLGLPNQLLMNNNVVGPELLQIAPKFCSPLKRQVTSEFYFTKFNSSVIARQNKQIVESLISTLGLQDIVGKQKKKPQRDTKEIAVQTMKPSCEMCEIRASTKYCDVETITDREYFSSTVHTQVVDQDLLSSKSTFNPTGAAEGANMSIAHMTPAQLVSQLAARAKTLKQAEMPPSQYRQDYDGRSDQYRYYNKRY